jgi:hypothetical protein
MSKIQYELAKELKEAGFPLTPQLPKLEKVALVYDRTVVCGPGGDTILVPSLEQLIEACKSDDYDLTLTECKQKQDPPIWEVSSRSYTHPHYYEPGDETLMFVEGPTLEEALAKFWLALNKK